MKNAIHILRTVLLVFALVAGVGTTLANSYILFAPDEWPKPFYLTYRYPIVPPLEEGAEAEGGEHAALPPSTTEGSTTAPTTGEHGSGTTTVPTESEHTEGAPAAPVEIRPGQGIMIDTGTKIVNLLDPTGRKYLRSTIILEFAPTDLRYYTMEAEEKTLFLEEFNADVNTRIPVINDVLISLLASQTFESVYTAEGKEALRNAIMDTINKQIPEYRVIFVYFTEFVVQ